MRTHAFDSEFWIQAQKAYTKLINYNYAQAEMDKASLNDLLIAEKAE